MARRALDARGRVRAVEITVPEFAQLMDTSVQKLTEWQELVPAVRGEDGELMYRFTTQEQMRLARQRVAVLKTRMSVAAVRNVEASGRLAAYADLAADCPDGITAHVYRSFLVVVLVQRRTGLMLDAEGLALRAQLTETDPDTGEARISAAMAHKHLRLLQAVGLLVHAGERWEFSRLPACITGAE